MNSMSRELTASLPSVMSELLSRLLRVHASGSTNNHVHVSKSNGIIADERHARLAASIGKVDTPSAMRCWLCIYLGKSGTESGVT